MTLKEFRDKYFRYGHWTPLPRETYSVVGRRTRKDEDCRVLILRMDTKDKHALLYLTQGGFQELIAKGSAEDGTFEKVFDRWELEFLRLKLEGDVQGGVQ